MSKKGFKNIDDFILSENGLKYVGNSNKVVVPKSIDGKIIDKIAPGGFAYTNVKKVRLSNKIKIIGKEAFENCTKLTKIVIPDSVTNIEAYAFSGCSSLNEIELSNNITEIESYAFEGCHNLKYIKLPEKIDYIGAYAFSETCIDKIIIPKGIKYLSNFLFYDCMCLNEVVFQEDLKTIGMWTFGNCTELLEINFPESITTISDGAFDNCINLKKIKISENLNNMGGTSFNNCVNLKSIEIDDINKKIIKYNRQNLMNEELGRSDYKVEYDTIYNLLVMNLGRDFKVIPIHKDKRSQQEIYEDTLTEGVYFKKIGKYEEAKEKYLEAIRINCKISTAYYNLGKLLYILGDFEASARSYKTAFELGREPFNLFVNLGHTLLDKDSRNGKYEDVILYYETYLNPYIFKKNVGNIKELKKIYERSNKYTEELKHEYEEICINASKKYLNI